MSIDDSLEFDKNHIWHPYSSAVRMDNNHFVSKADGVYLELANGVRLIDGMSSWWSAIHGYNVPELNRAITSQLERMAHVMFGGLTHEPAIRLSKTLLEIVPKGLEHIFYSDSGSVAVEVAMKMALQYWHAKNQNVKNKFITIRKGYHGDTWHTMSVCDPVTGMHNIFNGKLPNQLFISSPKTEFDQNFDPTQLEEVENILASRNDEIAAFILEPIVQGAGAMRFYHSEYLRSLRDLCTKHNVLLIADEIATGFGRTGKLFACEHSEITPDIMCIGKALTGGYLSFAATLCTSNIATTISDSYPGVFMHGPTFMGNPLACSVANASIKLLLSKDWKGHVSRIENHFRQSLLKLEQLKVVNEVRVLGAIGVVELVEPVDIKFIQTKCIENGIWLRPFGKLVYAMPPFTISDAELNKLTDGIIKAIEAYSEQLIEA